MISKSVSGIFFMSLHFYFRARESRLPRTQLRKGSCRVIKMIEASEEKWQTRFSKMVYRLLTLQVSTGNYVAFSVKELKTDFFEVRQNVGHVTVT